MKKYISIILSLCLVLICTVNAFATSDQTLPIESKSGVLHEVLTDAFEN